MAMEEDINRMTIEDIINMITGVTVKIIPGADINNRTVGGVISRIEAIRTDISKEEEGAEVEAVGIEITLEFCPHANAANQLTQ